MTDLFAASDIEKLFRETGGVQVSIFGTDTWGARKTAREAVPGSLFEVRPGGAEDAVEIATGVLPQEMVVDAAITVDGESRKVIDHRRVDDGEITVVLYGAWTHTVDTYRPPSGNAFPHVSGQQELDFSSTHLSDVSCDLMAAAGEVRADRSGDRASVEYEGRFPPAADIQPGDYVKVAEGEGPKRFRVVFVGDRTDRWRIPVELTESDQDF